MKNATTRRVLLAAVLAAPASSAFAQSQYTFQKSDSYALGTLFNSTTGYGSTPLSVAVDAAGNAYVGGYNSSAAEANVGIVKISGALSGTGSAAGLLSTQFLAPASRGLDAMTASGTGIYALHDAGGFATAPGATIEGGNNSSFVQRIDSSGNTVWKTFNAGGFSTSSAANRVSAIAVDPGYVAGGAPVPQLAMTGFNQGRVGSLNLETGVINQTFSGSVNNTNPGPIINANPIITNNSNHRALAFDSNGNIITGLEFGVGVGTRAGNAGAGTFTTVTGGVTTTLTPPTPVADAVSRAILKSVGVNNVGNGVAYLQGAATDELIAFSPRGNGSGANATISLTAGNAANGVGEVQPGVQTSSVQIRQKLGNVGYLTQTALTGAEDGLGNAYTGEVKNFATGVDANGNPALYVLDYISKQLDVYTIEPRYSVDANATWSAPTTFTLGIVPNSSTTNATFGNKITAPRTVTLDGNKTVKQLKFDSANAYTITNGGTITLAAPTNDNLNAYISDLNGSHTVNAPIVLGSNTRFDVTKAADTLTLNTVSGNGKVLVKRGAGAVKATSVRVNTLSVNEGLVTLTGNSTDANLSRVGALTLGAAAIPAGTGTPPTPAVPATVGTLDLGTSGLIVDYATTVTNPYSDLKAAITAGTIKSSAVDANHAVGIVDYSLTTPPTLGDPTLLIDATSVLVRYTLKGDATLDGRVNFDDLVPLAQNYNASGKLYQEGDFTNDGVVNFDDLVPLAQNYNGVLPGLLTGFTAAFQSDWALAQSLVPEPTTLLALAALPVMTRRRR